MLRSTVINQRQHVGLQKLSALAQAASSSLGPNKKFKFIQDEASGESTLAGSCIRVFENLELTCGVGQLVLETLQSHQRNYHTGSGCLLFLAGVWSRVALECLHRGIPVPLIITALSEGMDVCSDVCRECCVSIETLCVEPSVSCATTAEDSLTFHRSPIPNVAVTDSHETRKVSHKSVGISGQRKIRLSRHFCETRPKSVHTIGRPRLNQPNIEEIAGCLSHGCKKSMTLVIEAARIQSKTNQQDAAFSKFDVTKVVTCVLPGLPEEQAHVSPGCVVLLHSEQASVAHHLHHQHLNTALIHGDLSHTYRHLGFNRLTGVRRVCDLSGLSGLSKEEEWTEKVLTLLLKLDVNLVLVSGVVGEDLIHRCCRHRILLVEKVKICVLKEFASATGAVVVTYATQLSKHCVGTGVKVVIWRDFKNNGQTPVTAVNLSTGGNSLLVTVVITSPLHCTLQALEDQFWACAYRLHHALKDKSLLPGAAVTEMLCVHRLQKQAECQDNHGETKTGTAANPYKGAILHLLAESFIDYISAVMVNVRGSSNHTARTAVRQQLQDFNGSQDISANFSQLVLGSAEDSPRIRTGMCDQAASVKIYDNSSVKWAAWRRALDLVLLVLQTDAEVITGVEQGSVDCLQADLMLL